MNSLKKVLVLGIAFISIHLNVFSQEWKVQMGQQVPSFSVESKDGKKISVDDLKGKVVLLNFFATWCPPCREELPRLQKELWEELGLRNDFTILVLAREEGWNKLDPFMKTNKYTFPVFPDMNRKVFGLFAEQSIPRNVLLNKEGKIIYQSIGYEPKEFSDLIKLIKSELKK